MLWFVGYKNGDGSQSIQYIHNITWDTINNIHGNTFLKLMEIPILCLVCKTQKFVLRSWQQNNVEIRKKEKWELVILPLTLIFITIQWKEKSNV